MGSTFEHPLLRKLRDHAASFPDVAEGDACVNRSFKVRKKSFLFLGENAERYKIMLKLGPSLSSAEATFGDQAQRVVAGSQGWVTLESSPDVILDSDVLCSWIDESFSQQAPASLLAELGLG